ncbi:RNA polymerase II C-terminal domain phosphatase-like protein 2 isoform X2 [Tanacetum coccineum]
MGFLRGGIVHYLGVKAGPTTDSLGDALGISQHQDGVSGTSQQHAADDYAKTACNIIILNVNVAWCEYRLHVYGLYEVRISGDRNCQFRLHVYGLYEVRISGDGNFQVWFTCEKVDTGMGKTRKDAQQQAADNALCSLADKYVACIISRAETLTKDPDNQPTEMANELFMGN